MRTYVINLRRRSDRRERFLRWNANKGVGFEFLDAVDGRRLSRSDLIKGNIISGNLATFSDGAIGNALSHKAAWELCIDLNENIMIFEDDAFIHSNMVRKINECSKMLNDECHMIYLGYNRNASISICYAPEAWSEVFFYNIPGTFDDFSAKYDSLGEDHFSRSYDVRLIWGTLGYAISPRGAAALLSRCFPLSSGTQVNMLGQNRMVKPYTLDGIINTQLQRGYVKARCFFPPLAVGPNDMSESDVVTKDKLKSSVKSNMTAKPVKR